MTSNASREPLMTATEVADYLAIDVQLLYTWRSTGRHGGGPAAVKVGRKLRYRRADVDAWLAEHNGKAAQ